MAKYNASILIKKVGDSMSVLGSTSPWPYTPDVKFVITL